VSELLGDKERKVIISDEAAAQIGEALIKWFTERFGDGTMWQDIKPLIDVLIRVGLAQGIAEAERLLEGVVSDKPYAAWRAVIEHATVAERIILMEAGRQEGISDRVREIKAMEEWYSVLKLAIQVLVGIFVLAI